MTIFIPILFICLNGNCEFMQSTGYFKTEKLCKDDIERQKQHMRYLVKESGQKKKIEILEGTCVDFEIKLASKTEA